MATQYWLVKQEPRTYPWAKFAKDGTTPWTGVRNFQSRNNLRGMRQGDLVAYYHSGDERAVVGLARVAREAYADPTARDGDWSCVDLEAVKPLRQPVTLAAIKSDPVFRDIGLVRQSRLSVIAVTPDHFSR